MNCDLVFDHLTRGPIPSGDVGVDEAVESHLAVCHDCRALAEALRPAVGLFHEALAEESPADLPCYRGLLETGERAVAVAAPPSRPTRSVGDVSPGQGHAGRVPGRLAVAVALLAVGFGFGTWFGAPAHQVSASGLQRVDVDSAATLEGLGTGPACRPEVSIRDAAGGQLHQCCTVCHSAGGDFTSDGRPTLAGTLSRSCTVCHASVETTDDLRI